jgi:TolB-like protein
MGDADPRPTVFLSYARSDQEQAARLAAALQTAGLDVWWDALIEGGAAFAKSIEAALEKCDVVVACWSRKSVTSDWVLDEAGRGRDLRKLVPVTLDGTEPPLGFRQYQAVDLSRWRGDPASGEIATILRGIAAVGARPAPTAAPVPAHRAGFTRRRAIVIGAGTALAAAGGVAAWRFGPSWRGAGAPTSVAVLPFVNLSGTPEQDYFSDGLSEELRATLARNPRLQVMAQTSSGQFRTRQEDAVTIAGKLGVEFLLDGSVRRAGDVVRVTADVIDGASGYSRWSQIFERELSDIFEVQRTIAGAVAHELITRFAPGDGDAGDDPGIAIGGTRIVEAYDAYLRGRALYDLSTDEASDRAALAMFDAAIEADPGYAAAHAARARILIAIAGQFGRPGELTALYDAAAASAERAIALAPDLAEAHSTLGLTLFQGRLDARAARDPFERSRELGAGEATVLARYALYAARIGLDREASQAMERALVLDRLNPLIHRGAGAIEYAARRWAGSIAPVRRALAMNPQLSRAHAVIGDALLMLGRPEEARLEYQAEPAADLRLTGLAIVERRQSHGQAAEAAWSDLIAGYGDSVLYQQAQILADWGRAQEALDRLERALAVGDVGLIYTRNDPLLDPLRKDRRFQDLLERLGFD